MAAVVLAAGASRRMGSPKPLLPLAGETYLERILGTLATMPVGPIVVVLGAEAALIRAQIDLGECTVLVNERPETEMLGSLQLAIGYLQENVPECRAVLVSLVDMPRFAGSSALQLVTAFLRTAAPIVVPAHEGRHGHPVLFSEQVWDELLSAPIDEGARVVVQAHRGEMEVVAVEDPWVLRDADTPEQHRQMHSGP